MYIHKWFLIDEEEDDEEEEEAETVLQETDFKLDEFLQRCDMARQSISDINLFIYKYYSIIYNIFSNFL